MAVTSTERCLSERPDVTHVWPRNRFALAPSLSLPCTGDVRRRAEAVPHQHTQIYPRGYMMVL
ncbi:hypothetical protein BAY60_10310 [Prauserella muralis]|uniref:Uncharacterized protein n=1 Tax=Prauserella muralis TaxID=588067 RepID=A0A2V4AYW1_9PSEU|nr:hypothetical protein BAY60_10310 [Prauserella muralis]